MSEFRLAFPACVIAAKHRLAVEDIGLLRKHTFPDGIRTADDVVTMLALNNSCPEKCPEWNAFFVEQLAGFIVDYSYPQGSLDDVNAAWLIRVVSTDGVINSALELELVLHVMEMAAFVPDELRAFALDQLRLALCESIGGYKLSRATDRAGITRQDVDFVMRVLRGVSDGGVISLSRVTYDVMMRLAEATDPAANHPRWAQILQAVRLVEFAHAPRRSRWLRIVEDTAETKHAVA